MIDKELEFQIEVNVKASPSKLWKILTDPAIIKEYLFGTETSCDWKIGSKISFEGSFNDVKYKDGGYIIELEENKLLKYSYWSSFSGLEELEENHSIVSYSISENPRGGSKLTLNQSGFASEETLKHSTANWKMVLEAIKKIASQ